MWGPLPPHPRHDGHRRPRRKPPRRINLLCGESQHSIEWIRKGPGPDPIAIQGDERKGLDPYCLRKTAVRRLRPGRAIPKKLYEFRCSFKGSRDILQEFRGRTVGIHHAFDLVHGDQVVEFLRTGLPKVSDRDIPDRCIIGR